MCNFDNLISYNHCHNVLQDIDGLMYVSDHAQLAIWTMASRFCLVFAQCGSSCKLQTIPRQFLELTDIIKSLHGNNGKDAINTPKPQFDLKKTSRYCLEVWAPRPWQNHPFLSILAIMHKNSLNSIANGRSSQQAGKGQGPKPLRLYGWKWRGHRIARMFAKGFPAPLPKL